MDGCVGSMRITTQSAHHSLEPGQVVLCTALSVL